MDDYKSSWNESRRAQRVRISTPADLRATGAGGRYKIDMLDISTSGFRFETTSNLQTDFHGFLTLPGMSGLECFVAWKRNWIFGARFAQPLYPSVWEHIAARFPVR